MVFCNKHLTAVIYHIDIVTILILIDGFLQYVLDTQTYLDGKVTILILIDGFLQSKNTDFWKEVYKVTILILIDGFLQYCKVKK